MGKALPVASKFEPSKLGCRAPQSFRSGIVAAEHVGLEGHSAHPAANEPGDPLRDGAAAEQEDAFWHAAYAREIYYVAGRSYDQYRPAYAMGWQAAFDLDGDCFQDVEVQLERQWEACDTSSLLEWLQVRDAVHAAWLRGRASLQSKAQAVSTSRQLSLLRPLRARLARFARELAFLLQRAEPPLSAFMRQVLERHSLLLRDFLQELPEDVAAKGDLLDPFRRIATTMHSGWIVLKSVFRQTDVAYLLEFCEHNESQLLHLYRQMQEHRLSPELDSILQRQQRRLQLHQSKLAWGRQHWGA